MAKRATLSAHVVRFQRKAGRVSIDGLRQRKCASQSGSAAILRLKSWGLDSEGCLEGPRGIPRKLHRAIELAESGSERVRHLDVALDVDKHARRSQLFAVQLAFIAEPIAFCRRDKGWRQSPEVGVT